MLPTIALTSDKFYDSMERRDQAARGMGAAREAGGYLLRWRFSSRKT